MSRHKASGDSWRHQQLIDYEHFDNTAGCGAVGGLALNGRATWALLDRAGRGRRVGRCYPIRPRGAARSWLCLVPPGTGSQLAATL